MNEQLKQELIEIIDKFNLSQKEREASLVIAGYIDSHYSSKLKELKYYDIYRLVQDEFDIQLRFLYAKLYCILELYDIEDGILHWDSVELDKIPVEKARQMAVGIWSDLKRIEEDKRKLYNAIQFLKQL